MVTYVCSTQLHCAFPTRRSPPSPTAKHPYTPPPAAPPTPPAPPFVPSRIETLEVPTDYSCRAVLYLKNLKTKIKKQSC